MWDWEYGIVNIALVGPTLLANLFFGFCLVGPLCGRERLKQPVKILLDSLICSATLYLLSFIVGRGFCRLRLTEHPELCYTSLMVLRFNLSMNTSSSVWLNFFYYTQIVPAQQAVFVWVKRNIKPIIYWALLVDMVFFLFDSVFNIFVLINVNLLGDCKHNNSMNDTSSSCTIDLDDIQLACLYVRIILFFNFLCMMVGSSWATVRYLHGHMKTMKESDSSFSSPRLTSQIRVTITGILQGIYSFFCMLLLITYLFFWQLSTCTYLDFDKNEDVLFIFISLYMFGTTVNLGIGQSVFRQRVAGIWLKAKQAVLSVKNLVSITK